MQGRSTTTLPLRGAAVLVPVRRMWVRLPRGWRRAGALPLRRPRPLGRGRLASASAAAARGRPEWPARLLPSPRPRGLATRGARRGRSRPPGHRGHRCRRRGSGGAGSRAGPFLAASLVRSFFSSCLRRCSESGLLPALLARMASGGSLMSGFCGAGSFDFGRGRRLHGQATGPASCAGRFSRSFSVFRFSRAFGETSSAGFFFARARLVPRFGGKHRHFAAARRPLPGRNVVLAAEGPRDGAAASAAGRPAGAAPRPAQPARSPARHDTP